MDIIEINKFTQEKKVKSSRDLLYAKNLNKTEALRLIIYATKRLYGTRNTVTILHKIGVDKIDLSV